jgi:hypothetical protein
MVSVSRRDISQLYIRVIGPSGETIYGDIGVA